MKNVEYVTIETKLPAEAVRLLDRLVRLSGEDAECNRQQSIEVAVAHYLYNYRNLLGKEFKKDVVRFYNEWQPMDDEDQEAA
ncbi:hypothetical protein [Caballeronia sp. KNU42]